jgi:hypothetical protein
MMGSQLAQLNEEAGHSQSDHNGDHKLESRGVRKKGQGHQLSLRHSARGLMPSDEPVERCLGAGSRIDVAQEPARYVMAKVNSVEFPNELIDIGIAGEVA